MYLLVVVLFLVVVVFSTHDAAGMFGLLAVAGGSPIEEGGTARCFCIGALGHIEVLGALGLIKPLHDVEREFGVLADALFEGLDSRCFFLVLHIVGESFARLGPVVAHVFHLLAGVVGLAVKLVPRDFGLLASGSTARGKNTTDK